MKKLVALLLALTMVFAMTACGSQETATDEPASEGLTAIPLGEGLDDLDVSGAPYGVYNEIDLIPELAEGMQEGDTAACYYAEDCDTPYITVFHFPKKGDMTLEEYADETIKVCGAPAWKSIDINGDTCARYECTITMQDGTFYYDDCWLFDIGDNFLEIDYFMNCEEVALGDSGQYLWIPTGYTDSMDENEIDHDTIFFGKYSEKYYTPSIWIAPNNGSYEYLKWYWSDFVEELPFDEATYNGWKNSGWTEESVKAYYEALGYTYYKTVTEEHNGCQTSSSICHNDSDSFDDLYVQAGDTIYNIVLYANFDAAPIFGKALLDSLHSK